MHRLPSLSALVAILVTVGYVAATDHKDKPKKDDHRPAVKKPEHRDDHRKPAPEHRHPPAQWGKPPVNFWIHKPGSHCACDQGAPYKIQDCRPALTAKGTTNFIRIFEAAAARGVENATIRAMNAANVAPTNNGQPCAENTKPTPAIHPRPGR